MPSIRTTFPVPGVGKGLPVVFSSAYSRPFLSNANPRMVEKSMNTVVTAPEGVIFKIFDEVLMGKVSRLPT